MTDDVSGYYDSDILLKLDKLSLRPDNGEAAREYLETVDLEADWYIFRELRVGSLIRVTRGAKAGLVFDTHHMDRKVVSVIFEDGSIEKISLVLWLMLGGHYMGHYELDYRFESDDRARADYSAGVFYEALHKAASLAPPGSRLPAQQRQQK